MSDTSLTFTLTGRSSVLEAHYFPPIELSRDKQYVLGLTELLTSNSIPNIDKNNKFYIGDQTITIPVGSYEIEDIEKFIQSRLVKDTKFKLAANNATLKTEINSSKEIDFRREDSIGRLLGFEQILLAADETHHSSRPVEILKVNALRVECSITEGAYINNQKARTIHEFFPSVPAGFKIVEVPKQIIYLPVSTKTIDHIALHILDQDGEIVNFRGEVITIRLHLKSVK
jgi:hypothetical protein